MLKLTSPETSVSVGFPAPGKCFSLCGRAFLLLSLFALVATFVRPEGDQSAERPTETFATQ